ncbi:MAG TPA: hypothetical protein VMV18_03210 [bacterium]|nr:hypothetical protein [bacterium]
MAAPTIQAMTLRVAFYGGKEIFVHDLPALLSTLAEASTNNQTVEVVELLGKAKDGTDLRVALEPVGVFKESAPIGYQPALFERALGEILMRAGIATPEQVQQALTEQAKSAVKERLGEVFVRLKIATPDQVRDALLKQLGQK